MLTRTFISTLLIIAVLVWGAFLWALGIELNWEYAKPYSLTLGVLTFSLWLFNKYLWSRWPIRNIVRRPNLNGTWRVEIQSSYRDENTGLRASSVRGFAAIRQTFSSISIRLMTEESESVLVASSIDQQQDGTVYIYGVYQSDPSILLRSEVSEIHYGSFRYKVIGSPVVEITGHYWTDRGTNGSIRLFNRNPHQFDSHDTAERQSQIDKH